MPNRTRRKGPLAILHAAITVDGKLAAPPPRLVRGTVEETAPDAEQTRAAFAAGAVDEIFLTVRPRIDGRRDAPTLTGPPAPEFLPRSVSCRLLRMETRDGECLLHYRVVRSGRASGRSSTR